MTVPIASRAGFESALREGHAFGIEAERLAGEVVGIVCPGLGSRLLSAAHPQRRRDPHDHQQHSHADRMKRLVDVQRQNFGEL